MLGGPAPAGGPAEGLPVWTGSHILRGQRERAHGEPGGDQYRGVESARSCGDTVGGSGQHCPHQADQYQFGGEHQAARPGATTNVTTTAPATPDRDSHMARWFPRCSDAAGFGPLIGADFTGSSVESCRLILLLIAFSSSEIGRASCRERVWR